MKIDQSWIVVVLLTEGPYELEFSTHLLPSLQKFNIPYHIEVINSKGSWLKNVAQKPGAIYNVMEKYPNKDIVCLDADCEILCYPELFDDIPEEYDIAFHTLEWNSWYKNNSNVKELLSGTLWINNSLKTKELVKDWYFTSNNYEMWEQKVLSSILTERTDIKVYNLPLNYCYISTLPDGKEPYVKCDNIIIKHHNVSRKYKKLIK